MHRLGVSRRCGENLAVDLFGVRPPADGMKLLALTEQRIDLLRPFAHAAEVTRGGQLRPGRVAPIFRQALPSWPQNRQP
jgi:hypothetical protein